MLGGLAEYVGQAVAAGAVLLALPIAGLVLLLVEPDADAHWQHRPTHFWLILGTALVNVVLGLAASEAARRRGDARASLVSLAFPSSAGFLALHALATPGQLVHGKNTGFDIATPVGLVIGALFAAASAVELSPAQAAAVLRREGLLRGGLFALLAAWAVASLAEGPPLDRPVAPEDHRSALLDRRRRRLRALRLRHDPLPRALPAPARPVAGRDRGGVGAARGGTGRDRARAELAPLLVGVAPDDDRRVRARPLGRLHRLPPERLGHGGLRRRVSRRHARASG